jgi:DNA adenine methylase
MTTVLRYPGGKTRAVKHIVEHLPDSEVYVSPFFGGGAIELYLASKGKKIIANDKFEPLYNFWTQLKTNKHALKEEVEKLLPFSKEKFYECRSNVMDTSRTPLQRAAMYFALNRSSFSGATLSGGYSEMSCKTRFNQSAIDRLMECDLSNIEFYNMDFAEFLQLHGNRGVLYLDPPYMLSKKGNKLYGIRGDLHESFPHATLATIMRTITRPWVMSYNDSEEIRNLYDTGIYVIEPAKWSYGMNKTKGSSEIIIKTCLNNRMTSSNV